MMPASPWIGSTRKAAVFGVIAASSAAASPNGTLAKPGVNGPKPSRYCGFAREADDGRGAAGEVAGGDDDLGPSVGHALDLVGPLARRLDRGLDRLGAGVHRQRAVHAGESRTAARRNGAEPVGVEGAAGDGQRLRLLDRARAPASGGRGRSSPPSTPTSCRGSAGRRCRTARRLRRARATPAAGRSCARRSGARARPAERLAVARAWARASGGHGAPASLQATHFSRADRRNVLANIMRQIVQSTQRFLRR